MWNLPAALAHRLATSHENVAAPSDAMMQNSHPLEHQRVPSISLNSIDFYDLPSGQHDLSNRD